MLTLWAWALAPAAAAPGAAAPDTLRLDVFQRTHPPNEPIANWNARKIAPLFGSGADFFFQFVVDDTGQGHLHVRSGRNNSFSVGAELPFELGTFPALEWEWKVTRLPTGGDVRVKARDDQAGSLCVIVNPGLVGFESMCYLWENTGPIDTPITSTKRDDSRYLILHVGTSGQFGTWVQERRNMLADYRRVFRKDPVAKAIIGVQIDSDSTESSAEAFYRNIVLHRR
ncbi:MAG: DUF3047 domain-containing protein [Candidatus Lambdaproteobacteria bacterium]|nr:DUF3047 domain-containing protein [Candidatus Lambdaproteobacteria bacterium]